MWSLKSSFKCSSPLFFCQILRYFHRQRALGRRSALSPRLATCPYAESNRDNAASTVTRVPADLQPQICDSSFKSFHSEEAAKLDKGTSSSSEWKMKTALNGWEILHYTSRQCLHVSVPQLIHRDFVSTTRRFCYQRACTPIALLALHSHGVKTAAQHKSCPNVGHNDKKQVGFLKLTQHLS